MNNSEMINEFLDGTMMAAEEDSFLTMLATSDELKSEFKKSLFIDKTLKEDAAIIGPSTQSTMKLFSALGIANTTFVPKQSFVRRSTKFVAKQARRLAPVLTAALVATIVTTLFFTINQDKPTVYTDRQNTTIQGNNRQTIVSNNYPLMSSYLIDNQQGSTLSAGRNNSMAPKAVRFNTINTVQDEQKQPTAMAMAENNTEPYQSKYIQTAEIAKDWRRIALDNKINSGFNEFEPVPLPIIETASVEKLGLTVYLSGHEDKSFKNEVVGESSNPMFSKNGIEVMYKFSEGFEAGVDVRQEYFYQEYEGYEGNIFYHYYQHPNLVTAGLAAKFHVADLFDNTELTAKAGVGFNEAGVVPRAMIGIDYNMTDDLGFTVGIEGSNLIFYHVSNVFAAPKISLFAAPKIGLVYSLKFNL